MFAFRGWISVSVVLLWTATGLTAQDANQLGQEGARLNQVYRQRVSQLRNDPSALTALRDQERDWIRQRDKQCGKDVGCLIQSTKAHADYFEQQVAQNDSKTKPGSPIAQELWGKWTIEKILPTQNAGCWDQKQANALVATSLEYRADSLAWKDKPLRNLGSTTTWLQAKDFAADNSGSAGSVDFHQLGINSTAVQEIEIRHPDASVYEKSADCCASVPGETVMITGRNTMVLGVCGIYYGASRVSGAKN
jgi:hypothetical protein